MKTEYFPKHFHGMQISFYSQMFMNYEEHDFDWYAILVFFAKTEPNSIRFCYFWGLVGVVDEIHKIVIQNLFNKLNAKKIMKFSVNFEILVIGF